MTYGPEANKRLLRTPTVSIFIIYRADMRRPPIFYCLQRMVAQDIVNKFNLGVTNISFFIFTPVLLAWPPAPVFRC